MTQLAPGEAGGCLCGRDLAGLGFRVWGVPGGWVRSSCSEVAKCLLLPCLERGRVKPYSVSPSPVRQERCFASKLWRLPKSLMHRYWQHSGRSAADAVEDSDDVILEHSMLPTPHGSCMNNRLSSACRGLGPARQPQNHSMLCTPHRRQINNRLSCICRRLGPVRRMCPA